MDQRPSDVRKLLASFKGEQPHAAISDFHCLLYLATAFDPADAAQIAGCVAKGQPLGDGYKLMLESLG